MKNQETNQDNIGDDSACGRRTSESTLPGPEPNGPEVLPIRALHRHNDGLITFHRKDSAGDFRNLFAIRAEHLEGLFPEFRDELESDSFFSVNAFWHPSKHRHRFSATEIRQRNRLRYLCGCYVDLDTYRVGIDFATALGMVISYQDRGLIPPASAVVQSGRGLWLLWFLHDEKDPALPQRAFPEKVRLYLDINRAAGLRLAQLGADSAARDALRLTRVPGSLHTGTTCKYKRVKDWIQADGAGEPRTYTLAQLADAFGVEPRLDKATRSAFAESALRQRSRFRGPAQLNMRRLREFNLLRSMRSGFDQGHRNHAALLYAWLLRRSGMPHETVLKQVETLGRDCHPPLDLSSCRSAVKTAFGRTIRRVCDRTISDWLDITPAEAENLEKLLPASRFHPAPLSLITPPINAAERRSFIWRLVAQGGAVPSCRQMARLLASEGHHVSHETVFRDYRVLGLSQKRKAQDFDFSKVQNMQSSRTCVDSPWSVNPCNIQKRIEEI